MKYLTALALTILFGMASPAHAQRGGGGGGSSATCRPPNEVTDALVTSLKTIASSSDPDLVATRQRRQLPNVAVSQVSYVTDNAICAKAEQAYTAAIGAGAKPRSLQVHVIQVGTVYVVWDPAQSFDDVQLHMTISNKYKVLTKTSS